MDRTLLLVKPDAVERGLVGRIISRFEAKGLRIVGLKILRVDRELAECHYEAHRGRDFFEPLVAFITSAPVVAAVLEGNDAVAVVRGLVGATDCAEAAAGTVRGDLGMSTRFNLVHASDSTGAAEREIARFFGGAELLGPGEAPRGWIYDTSGGEAV